MQAIRIYQTGGPEVLSDEELPLPEPGEGQARVKIEASGVNYADIYQRKGLYPDPLPATLGSEAAGVVDAGSVLPSCAVVLARPKAQAPEQASERSGIPEGTMDSTRTSA